MSDPGSQLALPVRYTRSIHLVRDFANDRIGVHDYQATPLVLQTTERILEGLLLDGTARAFSIIGPYGSGKSAFGVFLAHYLRSDQRARQRLVAEHSSDGVPDRALPNAPMLLPVLVSGNNDSLRQAVLRGLHHLFESMAPLHDGRLRLPREIAAAAADPDIDPQQVADLFAEACVLVADRTAFAGMVLIIDELGQFLDYAARQADARDLFVLQTLAETAARSASTPAVVLTILHQSFDRYASRAGAARRTEWAKVQGRFTDLPFQEPPVQMLRMVGRALCPPVGDPFAQARRQWAEKVAPICKPLGIQPADVGEDEWRTLVARAYPLHPTVLVALPLLFRQLAQNERSLFAFLTSPEPWSVQEFLRTAATSLIAGELPIYRLAHLYAYIQATLGAGLFSRARGQRWAELAEALTLLPGDDGLLHDVLTTIGILGALGQVRGLRASHGQVTFALDGQYTEVEIERALNELDQRRHITYRQHRESFVIWEGSDLDLDQLAQAARREIGDRFTLVKLLEHHADSTPLVARRHSYQTGAARAFAVRFVDPNDLAADPPIASDVDGELLYIVPADDEALAAAEAWATQPARIGENQRIVVLPRRVRELRDTLLDVAALQHVLKEQPELENDRAARRELSSRLVECQQALSTIITELYGSGLGRWFWCGTEADVRSARQVDELLSGACDQAYSATPRIWNELIVRRQISGSAAKARRNLIEAMLDYGHVELLGLTGYPPERAIYASVLRSTGVHRQDSGGTWHFGPPPEHDPLHIKPAWDTMQQFIDSTEGQARSIVELYQQLEAPPFGVKAGLAPLLVIAAYMANAGEVAWYEHGNYVPTPNIAMFERLQRQPGYFSIRRSRATGARVAIYERLARTLAPRALGKPAQVAILDAVTPLLRLINTLPAYSRTTKEVSPRAQAVRQAILDARAPDELLFEKLPLACDLLPFAPDTTLDDQQIETFFAELSAGLQELQEAYAKLIVQVQARIRSAFGVAASENDALRAELTERYRDIAAVAGDSQVRALGVRLENAEPGNAWVESVAALVGRKPLDTWNDADLASFALNIADLGRRFRVVEQVAITSQALSPGTPVLRIGISNGQGEVSTVVRTTNNHPMMQRLHNELQQVLAGYDTLSLEQKIAVLTELLQPNLEESANGKDRI